MEEVNHKQWFNPCPGMVAVELAPMQQLTEAVHEGDDWTGITDAKARRKRQNRLHQRAWRKRKALETQTQQLGVWLPTHPPTSQSQALVPNSGTSHSYQQHQTVSAGITSRANLNTNLPVNSAANPYIPHLYSPLTTLVSYNVYRAILSNLQLLSLLPSVRSIQAGPCPSCELLHSSRSNRLTTSDPVIPLLLPLPHSIPPIFQPTATQLSVPHPSWISMFPLPRLRDNLIKYQGSYDEDELCEDMIGGWLDKQRGSNGNARGREREANGVIVWDTPWNIEGWEVSPGFCKKWKMLMEGCEELIEVSDRWRLSRGEERLGIVV